MNQNTKNKILNENRNKVNKSVVNKQRNNIIEDLFFLNEQNEKKLYDENKEVDSLIQHENMIIILQLKKIICQKVIIILKIII